MENEMNEWQLILDEFDRRRLEITDPTGAIQNIQWVIQAILEKLRNDAEIK